ncbi:hypothetical protein C3L33_10235, partial [Rhododendron williamsianum]
MSSFKSPLSLATSGDGGGDRVGLSHRASGEVHVIVGPMFAGKTTALLRRVKAESNGGRYLRAFFTLRKTGETKTELIGGSDVYMPVCRQHYVNGQAVVVAVQNVLKPCSKIQSDSHMEEVAVV